MLALMAEREQTRTLCVQSYKKYFKKTAFGEEINAISAVHKQWELNDILHGHARPHYVVVEW